MQGLPISTQTFEKLREQDWIYVDKTQHVHALVSKGTYYFLARPRRFGKSLLLSTLKAYFQGKKELFEGLYIYDKEKEWKKHPVVHLDYSSVNYREGGEAFKVSLTESIKTIARQFGITLDSSNLENNFQNLIIALYEKHGPVVILIDEYDKAMVDVMTEPGKFKENRDILRGLYGSLKSLDQYLRFVFLTGVSQFAKVNVFSGMNNLKDISIEENYSTIVGFSEEEIRHYFPEYLELLRQRHQVEMEVLMAEIKRYYNGFSFDGVHFLYNPFSFIALLSSRLFENYWFSSGTPNFLMEQVMLRKELPENFEGIKVRDLEGKLEDTKDVPLIPLLFQTGYLTIKQVIPDGFRRIFVLDFPNEEVRLSFTSNLLAAFMKKNEPAIQPDAIALREALLEGKTDAFLARLQSFFADIPARLHIEREAYYHSLVYMVLRVVGMRLILEKETDKGRIDAVLELPDRVYVMEFKFAQSQRIKNIKTLSSQALKQIEEKGYHQAYLGQNKPVVLFGIGFLDKKLDGRVRILG